jgi:uncharacterized membrane protein YbhN (UPF0104 family)
MTVIDRATEARSERRGWLRKIRGHRSRDPGASAPIDRRLATFGLLLALAVALLFSVPGLRPVRHEIGRINPVWLAVAFALELASDVSFVVVFRLFFDRLKGRDARLLAWTDQSSSALFPAGGVGGLAIGGWLIHLIGAPSGWIIRRSGGLFWLTTAANAATLIGAGAALILGASGPRGLLLVVLPTVLVAAATLAVAAFPRLLRTRPHPPRWVRVIGAGVLDAEQTTFTHPSWRLIGALGYLGFDMAVLWVCLAAVGPAPNVPALILAYNIGYLANWLPIPGSIGALDAGLTGALALYGISATHAATAVVIYHAIALLIPSVGGLLAYTRLRPRLTRGRQGRSTRQVDADSPGLA